jgi:hypothetical protein
MRQWSITTHDRLFAASEHNHLYDGEEVVEEEINIDNVSSISTLAPSVYLAHQ